MTTRTLTLVVPKEIPASGPLRIIVSVPGFLLHLFHSDIPEAISMDEYCKSLRGHPVAREIAQMAANTCQRSASALSEVNEGYMGNSVNDSWDLVVTTEFLVPGTENDPFIAYFQANKELDDEGNVEFIPVVPRTVKAREKYQALFRITSGAEVEPTV